MYQRVMKRIHSTSKLDDALKYEHVSAIEGTLDDSFKGTPTFEV